MLQVQDMSETNDIWVSMNLGNPQDLVIRPYCGQTANGKSCEILGNAAESRSKRTEDYEVWEKVLMVISIRRIAGPNH